MDLFEHGAAELERARRLAEKRYNETLTALDRSVQSGADRTPSGFDTNDLERLNQSWDPFAPGRGVGAALRRLASPILRLLLGPQRAFNAALVAHLNRQAEITRDLAEALRAHIDGAVRFQSHVVWYAQTVAGFIDTRERGGPAGVAGADTLHAALGALSDDWLKRWESLAAREARYEARHASVSAAHDELRDLIAIAQQQSLSLKREVERLLAATQAGAAGASAATPLAVRAAGPASAAPDHTAGALDAFKYVGFEDRFRGSQAAIRARLASYVPLFAGAQDVLEIGCGRGEFLDLLRECGVGARGIDINHEMVEGTKARGLDAVEGDALAYLETLPDGSLGGLFAAQVAEHLEPGYLMRLIETAGHKIRPGGLIVLETINPSCWSAFFDSYLRDLTHVRALHPDTLQYLVRASGFHDVTVEFRSPIPESDRLQTVPLPATDLPPTLADVIDAFNANVNRLNARLFTHQDYAVVGKR
jgi:SAM-dependent methyltransferase